MGTVVRTGVRKERRPILDDQIERALLRLMPELPRVFEKLMVDIEVFDGSQPRTFLSEIEGRLKPIGEKLQGRGDRLQRILVKFLGKFPARVITRKFALMLIRIAKTAASADKRYSLLLRLFHEVDQKIPLVSLMVASEYVDGRAPGYVDAKAFFVAQSTVMNLYKRAQKAAGEERSTLALIAYAKTIDLLYKPYLIALWFFSYVKMGKPLPSHTPELGTMMAVIVDRLPEYSALVNPDAVWLRNSAVHNEPHYEGDDSIWMWDRKHSKKKLQVRELMELTESLYVISTHTIQSVSQLYFVRDFILNTGLLDMMADCIGYAASEDHDNLKAAEAIATAHAESLLKPLRDFVGEIESRRTANLTADGISESASSDNV